MFKVSAVIDESKNETLQYPLGITQHFFNTDLYQYGTTAPLKDRGCTVSLKSPIQLASLARLLSIRGISNTKHYPQKNQRKFFIFCASALSFRSLIQGLRSINKRKRQCRLMILILPINLIGRNKSQKPLNNSTVQKLYCHSHFLKPEFSLSMR